MKTKIIICFIALGLLAGCGANRKPYDNSLDKNVTINLVQGEDSKGGFFDSKLGFFASVDIVAGVNDLDDRCRTKYKGYVDLEPGDTKIGLKPDQLTYLMVEVTKSASGGSSSFSEGTLIKPKKGYKYELHMNYSDGMSDLKLYEIRKSKKTKMKMFPLAACKPKGAQSVTP